MGSKQAPKSRLILCYFVIEANITIIEDDKIAYICFHKILLGVIIHNND